MVGLQIPSILDNSLQKIIFVHIVWVNVVLLTIELKLYICTVSFIISSRNVLLEQMLYGLLNYTCLLKFC